MSFIPLHNLLPDIAERETRSITILSDSQSGLPPGQYGFLEMYCDERGCDCRRVFFYVVRKDRPEVQAVVAYGWEPLDFYVKWMGSWHDRTVAEGLKGPILNPGSPTTPHSPAILRLARDLLLRDPDYVARIQRHYRLFREALTGHRKPSASESWRHRRIPQRQPDARFKQTTNGGTV